MMQQIKAAEYPVGNVELLAGQVRVELLGRTETFPAFDETAGFHAGVWWIGERARQLGRPLRARIASPSQIWTVAVDLAGNYALLSHEAARANHLTASSDLIRARADEGLGRRVEQFRGLDQEQSQPPYEAALDGSRWQPPASIPPNTSPPPSNQQAWVSHH